MTKPASRGLRSFIHELRRRRVFRAAGVYVVAGFATLQGASVLVPALHLPDWTMTLLVVLALVGFPFALSLAWVFDIVPERGGGRIRLEATPDAAAAITAPVPRRLASPSAAPCVAVMPFLNLSGDAENEIFVDGITEDVIAQLSKIRALKVIARASVMPFKKRDQSMHDVASRLGATTLVDGSVRRIGEHVRIVAQLIDVNSESQLWAETYDRQLTDIFAIQTDVALHIAQALEAELSVDEQKRIRKEPTRSIAAYQLYLQGRHWFLRFNPDAFHRAIEYFGSAIAGDPGYALAHVGIAMAYAELVESGALAPEIGRPRATSAAREALRLDPGLAEAHCAVAHMTSLWDFNWQKAEEGFQRAIALNPNSADAHDLYGRMCAAQERFDDALALQRRAQELDPLAHRMDVATTLLRAGRYAEAEVETTRAAEFDPDYDRAYATLGWAQLKQGKITHGLANLERAVRLSPEDTQWLAQLGQARALAGDEAGARQILQQLEERAKSDYVASYHFSFIYTGLGEHDRALDMLERAFDERAGAIYAIKGSFLLAPLRNHPRFEQLLARLNLK